VNKRTHHYFLNIESLRLKLKFGYGFLPTLFDNQVLQSLKMSVDLTNLEHLKISHLVNIESSLILLQILKETSHLSSFVMTPRCLISSLTNNEVRKYFNKLIKKLFIFVRDGLSSIDSNDLIKFRKTFSYLEQLECSVQHSNDLIFILKHLSKLSHLKIKHPGDFDPSMQDINQQQQQLGSELNKKKSLRI
jgi:hypothetical protein